MLSKLKNSLVQQRNKGLTRTRYIVDQRRNEFININQSQLINFSSNDYLCLSSHPQVKKAFIKGVNQYGLGSGASAAISGYFKPHFLLEEKFAEFLQRERALLFNTGYLANLAVISTLANRDSRVIADKLCHASLLDGIQLSRAKLNRYAHNNIAHAEKLLQQANKNKFLITESIFSMEGDLSPIDLYAKLAKAHQTLFIVDDAHGIGVLGSNGAGTCEHFQLSENDVPVLVTPLGKALSSLGAIVSGSKTLIESLIQFSRPYRYTTALPPAIVCATLASLMIIQNETWRREKLNFLIAHFIKQARQRTIPLINDDLTPIKSILTIDNYKTLTLQNLLLKNGFFVSCIRPPTVPKNTARIRISLNCNHNEKNINRLLDLIAQFYDST